MDIPDYIDNDFEMGVGLITNVISTKTHEAVTINDIEIQFWGWNVSEGGLMKIYYLRRSKKGVKFEFLSQ